MFPLYKPSECYVGHIQSDWTWGEASSEATSWTGPPREAPRALSLASVTSASHVPHPSHSSPLCSCLGKGQGTAPWGSHHPLPCFPHRGGRKAGPGLSRSPLTKHVFGPVQGAAITSTPDSKSRGCSPGEEWGPRVGAEYTLHCWHPQSSSAAPFPGSSSQGPAASKLRTKGRGRRGHYSQKPASPVPPLMAAEPYVPQCQSALWWPWPPLPRATASAGGIPIPKINWHLGAQLQVGGGLKSPLPPWVSHHSLTGEQGDKRIFLHISNCRLAGRTQSLPPNGTCGLQAARPWAQGPLQIPAGPAEDGVSWQPRRTRELGGVVLSSAGGSKWVSRAILFSWQSIRTRSLSRGPAPG